MCINGYTARKSVITFRHFKMNGRIFVVQFTVNYLSDTLKLKKIGKK